MEIYNLLLVNYNKTGWIPLEHLNIKVNLTYLKTQSVPHTKHIPSPLQIQSANFAYQNIRGLFSDPHKTHDIFYSAEQNVAVRNVRPRCIYSSQ
jgi:hypothetical protein